MRPHLLSSWFSASQGSITGLLSQRQLNGSLSATFTGIWHAVPSAAQPGVLSRIFAYSSGGPAITFWSMCCRETDLKRYIENAVEVDPDRPVLVDKYLDRADELDVDALCDKDGNVTICGIMQHIEQAGVHSGEPSPALRQVPESVFYNTWQFVRVCGSGSIPTAAHKLGADAPVSTEEWLCDCIAPCRCSHVPRFTAYIC